MVKGFGSGNLKFQPLPRFRFIRERYLYRDHSRPRYSSVPRTVPSQFQNSDMKRKALTIPEITLIGGTRVALGIGLGLLLSDRLSPDARKGAAGRQH
jgi:hypothetical protein